MWLRLPQLNLARRYLWGALVAALIPLVLISVAYDRYSVNLLQTLVTNRLSSNVEAVAARMSSYISAHDTRLENIADLRDTTLFFESQDPRIADQLYDLLLLEVESPDIYAIELQGLDGTALATVPTSRALTRSAEFSTLPFVEVDGTDIIGPALPSNGRPGWILIRRPVSRQQEVIGYVAIRSRLASITELAGGLEEPGVLLPQLTVFDRIRVTPVGTEASEGVVLAQSTQFIPGWRLNLVEGGSDLDEPRRRIRYLILLLAIVSAVGLFFLFFKMSQRLSGYLTPLNTGAQAIASGDFSVTVNEDGPGELGALARSYNRMREHLEKLIASRVDSERRATLGDMAAGIAHEIRNPLTTVAATLHGLSRGEKDAERQDMYQIVGSELDRVEETITEFVNFAKPRAPEIEEVLVRDVLKSVKTLISASAHEHAITISVSGDSTLRINVDAAQLRQIILNLSLNAIQAMTDGGQLRFRCYQDEGQAKLVVADNGHGMDASVLGKLFRPFFTTRSGGTGLGLPITNQLVEANGGKLHVASVPGEGTTVSIHFPLAAGMRET